MDRWRGGRVMEEDDDDEDEWMPFFILWGGEGW